MNIRPRCREWLPLCTQQLRLRNLQAIHGVDIKLKTNSPSNLFSDGSDTQTFLYYTLHDHPQNDPFYRSEKVAFRMHLNVKWAEIQCSEMLKSNANCVCIKVWACGKNIENSEITKNVKPTENSEQFVVQDKNTMLGIKNVEQTMSALTLEFIKFQKLPQPTDTLLFNWAVYFSGLVPLSQNIEIKCCENSLIFQMNDEHFASPEIFSTECLRGHLALNYERYSASVPKSNIPTPDEFNINSPQVSRSSSPATVDWQQDLLRMSRTRYVQLNCARSVVRKSYNLAKLLTLQRIQKQRMKIQRESVEIEADIKRLSLRCITKEQLLKKPRTTSINSSTSANTSQYYSMGRALSLLLAEQQHVDPYQLLCAQQLHQQLESLKSKQRLLFSARENFYDRITDLSQQLNTARTLRLQLETWLSEQRSKLEEEKFKLKHLDVEQWELCQRRCSVSQHVERIMYSLCLELRDIYPIERNSNGIYKICGVPFPAMDGYNLNSPSVQSVHISDNISPMALSASLGYVAHLIGMVSVVLNHPLRNPIIYEGSRTRILDVIKDIPSYTSRQFPLFSQSSIATKAVKYAVALLNQNIAQLCFDITGIRCDAHAAIDNLLKIYATFVQMKLKKRDIDKRTLDIRRLNITEISNSNEIDGSLQQQNFHQQYHCNLNLQEQDDNHHEHNLPIQISTNNGEQDCSLSKSHSSVDMNHMIPPTTTIRHHNVPVFSLTSDKLPIDIQNQTVLITTNPQRNCRSVGSYTDSEEEVCHSASIKCFSNSESNLTSLQSGGHSDV